MPRFDFTLFLLSLLWLTLRSQPASTDVICEDSIDGQAPFNSNDVPCVLGCTGQVTIATGGLLPGSINETAIPYCLLDCVRQDATPSQSAAAPSCHQKCQAKNQMTPENIGWCMYWCVDGFPDVASTACIPSLEYVLGATSVIAEGETVTIKAFTNPPAWVSWYQTQTVLSKTGFFSPSPPSTSSSAAQTGSRAMLFSTTPTTPPVPVSMPGKQSSQSSPLPPQLPPSSAGTGTAAAETATQSQQPAATTKSAADNLTYSWLTLLLAVIGSSVCRSWLRGPG